MKCVSRTIHNHGDDPLICSYCFSNRLSENKNPVKRRDKLWVYFTFHSLLLIFLTMFFVTALITIIALGTDNLGMLFSEYIQNDFKITMDVQISYTSVILSLIFILLYLFALYTIAKKISRHSIFTKVYKALNVPIPTWIDLDRFHENNPDKELFCGGCFKEISYEETIHRSEMEDYYYNRNNQDDLVDLIKKKNPTPKTAWETFDQMEDDIEDNEEQQQ